MLSADEHRQWLQIARRYARSGIDAGDVLQEACLAAMKVRRTDLSVPEHQRYFHGMIRKTAWAMLRAQTRRQRHEQSVPVEPGSNMDPAISSNGAPDLSGLPTSLQSVANLVMANLDRDEIRRALSISDDALRGRLADLRQYVAKLDLSRGVFEDVLRTGADADPADIGLIRKALIAWISRTPGDQAAVGMIDPDGHLIAVAEKSPSDLTKPNRPAREG